MTKKVTMQQLADEFSVSRNTVYKALNNKQGISPMLKKEILAKAREYGCIKNEEDHSTCSVKRVAVLIKAEYFTESTYYSKILIGIENALREKGCAMFFTAVTKSQEENLEVPPHIDSDEFDGVILIGKMNVELLRKISIKLPIVAVDFYDESLEIDAILIDNKRGMYKVFDHFKEKGITEIGYIGMADMFPSFSERHDNFVKYIKKGQMATKQEWIINDNEVPLWDVNNLEKLLDKMPSFPQAFICVNDRIAISLLKVLSKKDIRVPEDVAVIGFDNVEGAATTIPSLTTLNVYKEIMGARAVGQLIWRVENPDYPIEKIRSNVALVERHSV